MDCVTNDLKGMQLTHGPYLYYRLNCMKVEKLLGEKEKSEEQVGERLKEFWTNRVLRARRRLRNVRYGVTHLFEIVEKQGTMFV